MALVGVMLILGIKTIITTSVDLGPAVAKGYNKSSLNDGNRFFKVAKQCITKPILP